MKRQQALAAPFEQLRLLSELVDGVAGAADLNEIYEHALDGLEAALKVERSGVLLLDAQGSARFVASRGLSESYRRLAEGHFPWQLDADNPSPIPITDVLADASMVHLHDNFRREGIRSLAFIPLVYNRQLLGKFMLYRSDLHEFSGEELATALTIGRLIAFAVARRRIETTLRELDQSKDDFLAMLAHELRNPMAALSVAIDVLDSKHGAAVARETAVCKRQVQQLAHLIDDLTDVARITRGFVALQTQPVEVSTVVARALETTAPLIEKMRHHVVLDVPPRSLIADPVRLEQILENLIGNAAKYTPPGGTITITSTNEPEQVVLRIRDTGVGMSAELLPHVFDLFTQGARSLDRSQGGLGIGLTITKKLVTLHGGTIAAFSAGLGKGSELVVTLPAPRVSESPEPPAPKDLPVPAPVPVARRVLLVDDNVDLAYALSELVQMWGYTTEVATGGFAALAAVERTVPDIILVDIGLPEIDGYGLATRFRAMPELAGTSLIAISGYAQPADVRRSFEAGFVSHLVKPVDVAMLRRLLTSIDNAEPVPSIAART